jgi:hypothetical protein
MINGPLEYRDLQGHTVNTNIDNNINNNPIQQHNTSVQIQNFTIAP